MKYQFKFTNRNKTYFADAFAENEIEAVAAIKHIAPDAQNIMIRVKGKWRKPNDKFYNVRWFYISYIFLFLAGYLLFTN